MSSTIIFYGTALVSFVIVSIAQAYIRSSYSKYSKVKNNGGLNGKEAATKILKTNNMSNVKVEEVNGFLTDHYDPKTKTVRLSTKNYNDPSVAAVSIAAHECGHAIQDRDGYFMLRLRAALVPIVNLSSKAGYAVIMIGLFANLLKLVWLGIFLEMVILLFQLVTLPVEINASKRAMKQIKAIGLLNGKEIGEGRTMLISAALTYVASVASAIANILQLILVYGRRE